MLKYRKCGFQMCFVVTSGMHQLLDTRNGIDIHNDSIQVFNYNGLNSLGYKATQVYNQGSHCWLDTRHYVVYVY